MSLNMQQQSIINRFRYVINAAEIARLDKSEKIKKLIVGAALGEDLSLIKDIERMMMPKIIFELVEKYPFKTTSSELYNHDILNDKYLSFGKIKREKKPFVYPTNMLNRHGLILGATGTGKTNLLNGLILQCLEQGINVCIFDKDKQDYRHLRKLNPNLLVFNVQNAPINYLAPPTFVNPRHWLPTIVQVFTKTNSLLDGSESLLLRAMIELYEEFGVFDGDDAFPTIIDLYEKVLSYDFRGNYRSAGYQDSIINRLSAYISLNQKAYEYSKGIPIEWLGSHSFVLEVKGLTEKIARFTMSALLYALFLQRIASGQRGNTLRNLAVVDEAKWLAPGGYNENIGYSPLSYILSQSREAGIGLLIADQSANLEESVFVNSRLKICFNLGSGTDIWNAAKAMSLTREQAAEITKLETGECVVKIPREDAFIVKTDRVNLN